MDFDDAFVLTGETGTLYIVSTPIGNLSDISIRALEVLGNVDLIACEDTRNTLKLLNRFDIHTPLTSYHEHSAAKKTEEIICRLGRGENVAYVSDAGTPVISDPGAEMIGICIDIGIPVTAIPGPCALINALVLSGIGKGRFVFEGFLPRKKKERDEALSRIRDEEGSIVLYEAPHHLRETLLDLIETLGPTRRAALCREMTKLHEEVIRGTLAEMADIEPRGEYVIVIEGMSMEEALAGRSEAYSELTLDEHMEIYLSRGIGEKEAMRQVALDRGVSRRDIYNQLKR